MEGLHITISKSELQITITNSIYIWSLNSLKCTTEKKRCNMKQKYVNIQNKHTEIKEKCKYITELLHNDLIEIRWLQRLPVIYMSVYACYSNISAESF
jgi:hypothetical protein